MGNKYFNNGSAAILGILYAMEMCLRQVGLEPRDARDLMKKMITKSAADFSVKRNESLKYSLEILVATIGDNVEPQKYYDNPNNIDEIFKPGEPINDRKEHDSEETGGKDDTWDW